MKSRVQVVVIGGGVVGCSVLYHLTKMGWKDVVLIERSELTSGSTWHAAGGFHTLNADTNMAALQGYTIKLYKELEEISGQSCGLHHVGGITLASDEDRMDYLKAEHAKHQHMGLDTRLVDLAEIKELCPVMNTDGVIGGMYDPLDGHLDPSGTTHAYAKAAKIQGAEIYLRNRVLELNPRGDSTWDVVTEEGTVHTDYVINAGGLWAREVNEMAGVYLPLLPMEHQYIVTDDIPEVYERETELPHVMDPTGESYFRQEGRGLVLGTYEQRCEPWQLDNTPWEFGHELLENKLDRISESLEMAYHRYPCLEHAGIKTIINGPFTFAPDGNPLVGPVPGVPGYWTACAVMAGFSQGGGVGKTVAEWMVDGEASCDVFAMDVARFGDYCSRSYTRDTVVQNYQRRFAVGYPNEELPAGRPLKTTPMYGVWKSQNAVFGAMYGMEAVNYFAPEGEEPYEIPTFRRSNAFDTIGEECRAVREAVGLNEVHNFGKYEFTGPDAESWLNYLLTNRVPKQGRMTLSAMLNPSGKLMGDFTISRLGPGRIQLTASYGAQAFHMRWFLDHLPESGVAVENVSDTRIGLQVAGPNARKVMEKVTRNDVSNEAFPFLSVGEMEVGMVPAIVCRVSYTGALGYEIYVTPNHQIALYEALVAAGADLGMRPFGMRAMMSLRLEKSFGSWMREYKPDYTPAETGLDRFVKTEKNDFIGRDAAVADQENPPARKLVTMVVDALDADVVADEPIWLGDDVVGFVTSGGYAHYSKKSVAMGFVPREMAVDGAAFEIEILGNRRPATIFTAPLFDPDAAQMRG
ncbi:MAG: FAD-dependent oxidoreductase [Rhodospirillales bacterium]|jgi:dimethylglycine dehydrogenase|nr:FAD-dependent oxidoreductase [Rhodospirillales bacterium]MBT4625628.1 FAD-dependent oxidoreductase [Rhodospirillales bacterium]MBT5350203.1 FAD-dependent oxidoreductase [Rhodospirillales bacterium]MBT5522015.1 FAD-dependent oxidoreductase [Rhodospirillales bacterium]MBT6109998.1 FAD-dependent oxidoreductase [Rhodospirillales bacterium]